MNATLKDKSLFKQESGNPVPGGAVSLNTVGSDYIIVYVFTAGYSPDMDVTDDNGGTYSLKYSSVGVADLGELTPGIRIYETFNPAQMSNLLITINLDGLAVGRMVFSALSYKGVESSYGYKSTFGSTSHTFTPNKVDDVIVSAFGNVQETTTKGLNIGNGQILLTDTDAVQNAKKPIRMAVSERLITSTTEVTEEGVYEGTTNNNSCVITTGLSSKAAKRRIFIM